MADKRYSIDLHENTLIGRVLRIILGIAGIVVAVWYMYSIRGTSASIETAWIAIVFLILFSLWLLASGLGYTKRYIEIGDEKITLRQEFYRPPLSFTTSSLTSVEFKTLIIDFYTGEQKTTLRLGTYYPEQSSAIIEAVEGFCRRHNIEIRGENGKDSPTPS